MTEFRPTDYGPVFAPLLETNRRRPLDAGTPDPRHRDALQPVSIESAFSHTTLSNLEMARCCLSGLWLLYDCLDESHTISQGVKTTTGSFWHGIMHRREGDFSNAKYWFRNVGFHPVYDELGGRAAALVGQHRGKAGTALAADDDWRWEPFAFVDLCQTAVRSGSDRELCTDIQQAEWELLFDHCYRAATAA